MSQLAEADHGVEGDTDEEDHDGVEENVAVDDGEAGVEGEEHSSKGCCREALRQFPYCEETQGKGQNLSGERMDISSMRGRVTPTAVHPRRMPRMAGKSSKESPGIVKLKPAL